MSLKKGTQICCPNEECGVLIAEVLSDFILGEAICSEKFKGLNGYVLRNGMEMACPECGTPYFEFNYFDVGRLHTTEGWKP